MSFSLFNIFHFISDFSLQKESQKEKKFSFFFDKGSSLLLASQNRPSILVAKNDLDAQNLYDNLISNHIPSYYFPDLDVLPFTNIFPSIDRLADRVEALRALQNNEEAVFVTTVESFYRKIPASEYFKKNIFEVKKGDKILLSTFIDKIINLGYEKEYRINEVSKFSVRGDIVDIFSPGMKNPVRMSFFDDEIEDIRFFDMITQKAIKEVDFFTLLPANEFALKELKETYPNDIPFSMIHSEFVNYNDKNESLLEHADKNTIVFFLDNDLEDVKARYKQVAGDKALKLLWDKKELEPFCQVEKSTNFENKFFLAPSSYNGKSISEFLVFLEEHLAKKTVLICFEQDTMIEKMQKILHKFHPQILEKEEDLEKKGLYFLNTLFEYEFELKKEDKDILVLGDICISGKKRVFKKRVRQVDSFIEDIEQIKEGEMVVHINHGIALFKGIKRVDILGKQKDYIILEFAGKEKLFVPLEQASLIGKYIYSGTKGSLDNLSRKTFQTKKQKVQKSIEEFASKLVAIYAKRSHLQGHKYSKDTLFQKEFEDQFKYVETPDQVKVIDEIKQDMQKDEPMERLLCGDVGFGKTEVAMRAAFKAIMDNKQVVVLAPTTVLVEQHFYTFKERFQGFPVKIGVLSRFTQTKQLNETLEKLKNGKMDIVIGTHKLFNKNILFKNLGLVIMDEEHKFGVEHKERFKERYPLVDFLSLSATPIPRTLSMALSSLKDISLLQTPPDMRIPIETSVANFQPEIVKFAIEQELSRGGQVFFVHNNIKQLQNYKELIEDLVPSSKICIGHGQMLEEEIEETFLGFMKGRYNIFLGTTVIESGLDIPNANTIIINDAYKFGLSQLYQLKGRVGRANRQAYAYFLYPANKALTENAHKRLYIINEYTDLGAGYDIAMQDLEIRGAGNILGVEQHGNIIAIGYDMYMKLLRQEIEKLQGKRDQNLETLIDLSYSVFIPDSYISDMATKMEIYKKILSCNTEESMNEISKELLDRFGTLPSEVNTIFEITRLKQVANNMGVDSLMEKKEYIEINFTPFSKVDPLKVMKEVKEDTYDISIFPNYQNKIFYKTFEANVEFKVKKLISFLKDISE